MSLGRFFMATFEIYLICRRIIDRVVEYLLGDLKDKLLFCWVSLPQIVFTYLFTDNG